MTQALVTCLIRWIKASGDTSDAEVRAKNLGVTLAIKQAVVGTVENIQEEWVF